MDGLHKLHDYISPGKQRNTCIPTTDTMPSKVMTTPDARSDLIRA
jgi:hypothetical protein